MQYTDSYRSPLGPITLASDGQRLTGLWFDGQMYFASTLTGERRPGSLPLFERTKAWLDAYFAGDTPGPLPPLAPAGTPFRQAVWALLLKIPRGQVATYGQLARALAERQGRATLSAQAVGGAVAHNPISILIPCHRVVGSDGSLTGYAGGLDKKLALLTLEGVDLEALAPGRG